MARNGAAWLANLETVAWRNGGAGGWLAGGWRNGEAQCSGHLAAGAASAQWRGVMHP